MRCDSLPRLGFKEVACMLITLGSSSGKFAYKNEPHHYRWLKVLTKESCFWFSNPINDYGLDNEEIPQLH